MSEAKYQPVHYSADKERLLEDLPPPVRRYIYHDEEQFCRILHFEKNRFGTSPGRGQNVDPDARQYVVFLIDPSSFERDLAEESGPIKHTPCSYNSTTHILILKMVTHEHTQAIHAFSKAIDGALQVMGLDRRADSFLMTDVPVNETTMKLPDWGLGPRGALPKRPTIVLEVAVSEPWPKLDNDARMWVDPNRGKCNLAVTIKVNRKKAEIMLDKWEWESTPPVAEAIITQHIVISKAGDEVKVSEHPFRIPFHLIFNRAPQPPRETDIVLEKHVLIDIAEWVWETQGF